MLSNNLFNLKKKNIIITGSNSGIGLELSRSLIKNRANIIRIDLKFNTKLKSFDYTCDLKKKDDIANIFKKIKKKFKLVSGLVNCIGISIDSNNPYEDMIYYDETLNTNLKSVYMTTAEACKILKKNSSVINLTSLGAEQSFPNNPAYQISKSGLRQLTKSFARDYSKFGIRFNNICPGYIKTKMTIKSYLNSKKKKIRSDRMLINRWGKTSDLVGPTIFLLSNASNYITGSDIYVDGGWMAKGI
jgi:NAD(P)-dependent dehydrogenase (short-subunit alcohol dehydrogenase family)